MPVNRLIVELLANVPPPTNAPDTQLTVAFPEKSKDAVSLEATWVLPRQFNVPSKVPDRLPLKVMLLSKSIVPVAATL